MNKTKKLKHNYTSELELKSLLIRIKNKNENKNLSENDNVKINKYIKWHISINNLKISDTSKKNKLKKLLKERIVSLSENTKIDKKSFERFGEIILLMVKNILRKPQFSGYTYKDDFYSDAVYKILKYLHNFNHKLISERSGIVVNAFAYISQIIHNSIIYIIKIKNNESEQYNNYAATEYIDKMNLKGYDWYINDDLIDKQEIYVNKEIKEIIKIKNIKTSLVDELILLEEDINKTNSIIIYYPSDYKISFEEYNLLKPHLKGKVSIMRTEE